MWSIVPGRDPLLSLDFSDIADKTARPGLLVVEQSATERLLHESARESGLCDVRFGSEAIGLEQDARGVRLTYRDAGTEPMIEAEFVVGCDGAGSFVRQNW